MRSNKGQRQCSLAPKYDNQETLQWKETQFWSSLTDEEIQAQVELNMQEVDYYIAMRDISLDTLD